MLMSELIQRKPGAQPGNQNALKHGFYSKALPHQDKLALAAASGLDGLDQELAVLRIKFRDLLTEDGQNLQLINQTASTLARLYHIKNIFSAADSAKLEAALNTVLESFLIPGSSGSEKKSDP
jgi:hypothetical protein